MTFFLLRISKNKLRQKNYTKALKHLLQNTRFSLSNIIDIVYLLLDARASIERPILHLAIVKKICSYETRDKILDRRENNALTITIHSLNFDDRNSSSLHNHPGHKKSIKLLCKSMEAIKILDLDSIEI